MPGQQRRNRHLSPSPDEVRRFRITKWRVALVREGSIPTTWDKTVREAGDVATLMGPLLQDLDRETFWLLMLDSKNRLIGANLVSIGTLNAALVSPRELAKALILSNSAAAIVVHQHPSGCAEPSTEDAALTRRLSEVGDLIGVRLLDHLVLGHDGAYVSFAERGLLR